MVAPGRPRIRSFTAHTSASARMVSSWASIDSDASTCAVPPVTRRMRLVSGPALEAGLRHHLGPCEPHLGQRQLVGGAGTHDMP